MNGHNEARNLIEQEPGRENRHATAAGVPNISKTRAQCQTGAASYIVQNGGQVGFFPPIKSAFATHETADDYAKVLAHLCAGWRVIVCKDDLQWTVQRRKKGGGKWPWRAVGYCRTRKALIRLAAANCGRNDPAALAALAALPENFGGAV